MSDDELIERLQRFGSLLETEAEAEADGQRRGADRIPSSARIAALTAALLLVVVVLGVWAVVDDGSANELVVTGDVEPEPEPEPSSASSTAGWSPDGPAGRCWAQMAEPPFGPPSPDSEWVVLESVERSAVSWVVFLDGDLLFDCEVFTHAPSTDPGVLGWGSARSGVESPPSNGISILGGGGEVGRSGYVFGIAGDAVADIEMYFGHVSTPAARSGRWFLAELVEPGLPDIGLRVRWTADGQELTASVDDFGVHGITHN